MLNGIHVRLDSSDLVRIVAIARRVGVSRSFFVSLIVTDWLEAHSGKNRAEAEIARLIERRGGITRMRKFRQHPNAG